MPLVEVPLILKKGGREQAQEQGTEHDAHRVMGKTRGGELRRYHQRDKRRANDSRVHAYHTTANMERA
jgi:hypothetical protein